MEVKKHMDLRFVNDSNTTQENAFSLDRRLLKQLRVTVFLHHNLELNLDRFTWHHYKL